MWRLGLVGLPMLLGLGSRGIGLRGGGVRRWGRSWAFSLYDGGYVLEGSWVVGVADEGSWVLGEVDGAGLAACYPGGVLVGSSGLALELGVVGVVEVDGEDGVACGVGGVPELWGGEAVPFSDDELGIGLFLYPRDCFGHGVVGQGVGSWVFGVLRRWVAEGGDAVGPGGVRERLGVERWFPLSEVVEKLLGEGGFPYAWFSE